MKKTKFLGFLRDVWFGLLLVFFVQINAFSQSNNAVFPEKPNPAVLVHDYAGWLTPDEKIRLESQLQYYEDSTSNEIVVMIRPDLGDFEKADYAFELGNRWGIGKKTKGNGIVLLIKTQSPRRGAFIATGLGAEGPLPDAVCSRIIRDQMIPLFQQEKNFEGIQTGINSIQKALRGEFKAEPSEQSGDSWVGLLFMLAVILFLMWFFYRMRSKFGTTYSSRGANGRTIIHNGGGWYGGGGGWGGSSGGWDGGSSSGGGGWSGGDFGGGGFGGGGAGGDW
jgi:uncharacterized protein